MKKTDTLGTFRTRFIQPIALTIMTSLGVLSAPQVMAEEHLIDRIVAVVNETVILKSELNSKMYAKAQELAAKNIAVQDVDALQAKVLDSLILEKLQLDRAAQIGLQVSDDEINEQLQAIAQQNNLTLMALRNQLDIELPNGFQKIRQQIKTKLMIQKLREAEVISKAQVSENEVSNFLTREALEKSQVQVALGHILIALPESATPKQRETALEEAKSIHKRLLAGEDFSQLAVRHSDGGKALNGGLLGWLNKEEVPTFFADAIEHLSPGQISELIQSPSGFHIIKLIGQRDVGIQLINEYHLHRFIILSDNTRGQSAPQHISQEVESMKSLEDFKALAGLYPDTPPELNAKSDLGWKKLEQIPAVIQEDIQTLDVNRALPALATDKGWMILFLEDKRVVDSNSKNKTQEAIQTIRMRKANSMFDLWLRRLKDEAFIEVHLNN
ncbi:MAG: molecular chaperone SurA [Gammaproteobacteria bacterium]|nr:molecular chaperone SurA [Gammaproteobacteria bacterium]